LLPHFGPRGPYCQRWAGSNAAASQAAQEARKQAHEALLSGASPDQIGRLDDLLVVDPKTGVTPLAWVREISTAPKADNVRGLIARLQFVRAIGVDAACRRRLSITPVSANWRAKGVYRLRICSPAIPRHAAGPRSLR
jgi:hypothetical protein